MLYPVELPFLAGNRTQVFSLQVKEPINSLLTSIFILTRENRRYGIFSFRVEVTDIFTTIVNIVY